jgi:cytochrome c oxidase subunit 4
MTRNHVSPRATWATGAVLITLWAASFGLSYAHLGAAALPVALAIAAIKATLVFLVFMELALESFSIRFAIVAAISMIALLIGLMAADVATRPTPPLLPSSPAVVAR